MELIYSGFFGLNCYRYYFCYSFIIIFHWQFWQTCGKVPGNTVIIMNSKHIFLFGLRINKKVWDDFHVSLEWTQREITVDGARTDGGLSIISCKMGIDNRYHYETKNHREYHHWNWKSLGHLKNFFSIAFHSLSM